MNNKECLTVFEEIKTKIHSARRNAILAINNEMVMLYWNIGNIINEKSKWGNKFIENLARDIKLEFPTAKGYSIRNLKYMAKFAKITPPNWKLCRQSLHNYHGRTIQPCWIK